MPCTPQLHLSSLMPDLQTHAKAKDPRAICTLKTNYSTAPLQEKHPYYHMRTGCTSTSIPSGLAQRPACRPWQRPARGHWPDSSHPQLPCSPPGPGWAALHAHCHPAGLHDPVSTCARQQIQYGICQRHDICFLFDVSFRVLARQCVASVSGLRVES